MSVANVNDLLDEVILNELILLAQEVEPTLFTDLVGKFSAEYPEFISKMGAAIAAKDLKAIEHLAHSLKGQGAVIGARLVMKSCEGMEYAAVDGHTEGLRERLADIAQHSQNAAMALEAFVKKVAIAA